jgi:hypothetical protein
MRKKACYTIMFIVLILAVGISELLVGIPEWLLWLLAVIILINIVLDLNEWHKKMVKVARMIDHNGIVLDALLEILYKEHIVKKVDMLIEIEKSKETID